MDLFIFDGGDGSQKPPDRGGADRHTVYELERRLDRAMLTMEAHWSLLTENTELSQDDLVARMTELEGPEGKAAREPAECEGCGRATSRRHTKCLYCGHPVAMDPFA